MSAFVTPPPGRPSQIHLATEFGGRFGQFDPTTLLIQLTTSLSLLAMATLVTENIMLRFMPQKELYYNAKYDETHEFTDIRNGSVDASNRERLLTNGSVNNDSHQSRHQSQPAQRMSSKA